jgi:hypothetical protein
MINLSRFDDEIFLLSVILPPNNALLTVKMTFARLARDFRAAASEVELDGSVVSCYG